MKTEAAILVNLGAPLEIVELEIPALKPGQVLVEILMSGVCHTQVLEWRGHRGEDKFLPHCMGHEATGIVREIGPGVSKVKSDDAVILSWIKGSGLDVPGTQYQWNGRSVNAGGVTTFSRYSVVSENRLSKMPPGVRLEDAAVLGCALATGMGTVINVARPVPGQSAVVIGAGRIGLAAVAAAAASGCTPIVAVDINDEKLRVAGALGATHTCRPEALAAEVARVSPGGVDIAVEATGRPELMAAALSIVKPQGGTAVIVGNAHHGESLRLDPKEFNLGKRLLGTWGGDNVPDRDFPRYARLLASGRISLESMTARTYPLERVNEALVDLEGGRVVRPLIALAGA